jgi:subfamily B ATP-binding cassette protein MsbA
VRDSIAAYPILFSGFVVMTTAAALTEGLGIGLLVPLLNSAAPETGSKLPFVDGLLAEFLPSEQGPRMTVLVVLLALVILARGLLQLAASYVAILFPLRVQTQMCLTSYDAVLDVRLDFFARHDGGVLRTHVIEYPTRVAGAIKAMTDIIASAVLAAIYVVVMLSLSWSMTLIALALVGISGGTFKSVLMAPLHKTGIALSENQERWNTLIHETGLGLKLIRLLGAEALMRSSFQATVRSYFRHDAIRQLIGEAQSPLLTTFGGLFVCGLLLYGTTAETGLNAPQMLVLVLCLYRLTAPASRILTNFVIIDTNVDALERQQAARLSFGGRLPDGAQPFTALNDSIRFETVGFQYPGSDRPVLRETSFTIPHGKMVALIGPSGAGKTSIVNLLGRLYDPQSGAIMIDGVDLRDYSVADWRRRMSVVTQEITLFNMSVADNLTFGLKNVSRQQLEAAAEQAAALEFIQALPQGWDTRLGDRGMRLSGGQQQRLSLARAMLRDPQLLILDEATSQLDSLTERLIQRLVESYRGQRTILVIAHRLSTIQRADRIVVLRDGQVIEQGSHAELSVEGSHYRAMLAAQQLEIVSDESELTSVES